MDKVCILGIEFDNVTMNEAVSICNEYLQSNKLNMIVTPNPEIVMLAKKDEEFKRIINSASLVVPDGIGIIKAGKILKTPLKERVAGYDLICNFFDDKYNANKKVYILGAKPGVAEMAKVNIEKKYNIEVVGTQNGYFKPEDTLEIVDKISRSGANILLVGMGMKKQEQLIFKYKEKLNVNIAIGCGGSLDVLAGITRRAPDFWVKHNLEWLYRLIKQPSRLLRMMVLPQFLMTVIFNNKKGR